MCERQGGGGGPSLDLAASLVSAPLDFTKQPSTFIFLHPDPPGISITWIIPFQSPIANIIGQLLQTISLSFGKFGALRRGVRGLGGGEGWECVGNRRGGDEEGVEVGEGGIGGERM